MAAILPGTYSARDVNVSFSNPALGINILFGGGAEQGVNEIHVRMTTDRTAIKIGSDGTPMISAIPGDQGEIEVQLLQTSTAHQLFLSWLNQLIVAANQGDVSNWATTTCFIQLILNGTSHTCTMVAPTKMPDVPYAAEGATINWVFKAGQIINQ
jgi:hypothetical protein